MCIRDRGKPVHSYARERRVQLEYAEYPQLLVRAFLAAEDRTFFEHGGIDYPGIATAILTNLKRDGRPVGASTITQQVAKNLLLTGEVSYTRKIREAILAKRIEAALTKQQILELYLNEIPLGRRSFGVQAAARAYFDKDVDQLALHEMAFLAILPKAPETYGRARNTDTVSYTHLDVYKRQLTVPHCDPTVNLYDHYHVVAGDTLVAIWPVSARGRAR